MFASEKFRAVHQTIKELKCSPVYRSGLQMHDHDKGIRPDLINCQMTRDEAKAACSASFGYDYVPVSNPKSMKHFEPCRQLNFGLCGKDESLHVARTLSRNMYALARPWKDDFPVFIELNVSVANWASHIFLGRLLGGKKTGMFSKAVVIPLPLDFDRAELELTPHGEELMNTTLPVQSCIYFKSMLEAAAVFETDLKLRAIYGYICFLCYGRLTCSDGARIHGA